MQWPIVAAALSLASAASAPLHSVYVSAPFGADRVYINVRFGYAIAYPSDLIPQPESENSDGRAFLSRNGNVEATAWGMWKAAISQSTPDLARESETDCAGPPAYERIASTFFAMSCTANGKIIYEKQLIHRTVVVGFRITYPATARAHWDPVTATMANSRRAPSGE
jgi:hypothetical protein